MKNYSSKSKIDITKRSYACALRVIRLLDGLARDDSSCQIIGRQLIRSATSVGANIVEAQSASSKKDFTNYLRHSLKSANESRFWLGLLRDSNRAGKHSIDPVLVETKELVNILASSILKLKGKT